MRHTCTKVTLRQRLYDSGRISLYLDYYPAIRNPETMQMTRREYLGIYLYAHPKNEMERSFNNDMLNKAEAIAFGESFWGRIFNFGTVIVTTGGATNTYPYIADPLSFRRAISEEVDKRFGRGNE